MIDSVRSFVRLAYSVAAAYPDIAFLAGPRSNHYSTRLTLQKCKFFQIL